MKSLKFKNKNNQRQGKRYKYILGITVLILVLSVQGFSKVWTYNVPGGKAFSSPDYEVTVTSEGKTQQSYVYYSFGLDEYTRYNENGSVSGVQKSNLKGPKSHSHAIFSFDKKITVRVTIKPGAKGITLPLQSAKVLPSSYNIPCTIENGNTIVFTFDHPEKVAVIANYDQIWNKFVKMAEGHIPIQSWNVDYKEELKRESYHGSNLSQALGEGYDNPLIISALPPETRIPDTQKLNTLMIFPGDKVTEEQFLKYDAIWFKPGIHDLSKMGYAPFYQTLIKRGQLVYIEGGAYVMARFKRYHDKEAGQTSIVGRGVISGIGHEWIHSFSEASQLIDIDTISGVTITDRGGFSIYNSRFIEDVTLIGGWHGNTDGPDYTDNCLIQNCFFMSHDDNLKINHNTHAKHCVIWQATNAHSIMVKETFRSIPEFANSVIEDIDIITYFQDPNRRQEAWARLGMGAIACVTAVNYNINNFTFKNIRIESPYLYRIFDIYNLNTNEVNPGWFMTTTEQKHTRIKGMHFENITVTSPVISYRSLLGSGYDNSVKNITFKNIKVNGILITENNKDEFFEIQKNKIHGLKFEVTSGK